MAFDMALPHGKRVKSIGPGGEEEAGVDQDLWDLHAVVARALQVRGRRGGRAAGACLRRARGRGRGGGGEGARPGGAVVPAPAS